MPTSEQLREYLEGNGVKYSLSFHRPAYTARQAAKHNQVPPCRMAKTVMFVADGDFAIALLASDMRIDGALLGDGVGAAWLRLATPLEIEQVFPYGEPGALPPFGNLYGLPVYLDEILASQPEVVINGGSPAQAIQIRTRDLIRLSGATVIRFAQ
jgi:Ala-tRNA(Pro) deacylase